MALRFNGNSPMGPNPWSSMPMKVLGTASGFTVHTSALPLTAGNGNRMACHLTYGTAVGLPLGSAHPASWAMPSVAGMIASRNLVNGSGSFTATAQSGRNASATLTGSGNISSADLGLIVTIIATLLGSGGISSATPQALAGLVATLTGSGGITADASGLAQLVATLTGSGSVTANNTPLATMAATIRGYGDLTPEGIRDNIWNAVLANYPTTGTAGKTLSAAGSGGVDYTALGDAVRTELQDELLRIIEIAKIHGLVIGSDLVVTPTSRTAGSVAQTISGDGVTSSTVTRT